MAIICAYAADGTVLRISWASCVATLVCEEPVRPRKMRMMNASKKSHAWRKGSLHEPVRCENRHIVHPTGRRFSGPSREMTRLTSVLFLPALLCDASLWRAQIEDLRDIAAPAIADLTLDDTVAAMADRALAAAPETFALVALSMGGYVAFEMLRQAPERVTRLALLDTSAREDSAARRRERADAIVALEAGRFLGVTDRLLPQLIHQTHVHGPVGNQVKAMAARVGRDAFIRQQRAILGRGDSRDLLARITIPTAIGVGDTDVLTPPAEAEALNTAIAGSTLHTFAGCGHLPPLEKPGETSAFLRDWLVR